MRAIDGWTEIESVSISSEVDEVFDVLSHHPDWPFIPVVDSGGVPLGVVREWDMRHHVFARFGRELLKRQKLAELVTPSLILPCAVSRDELLSKANGNPNPDGILLTEGGLYKASLLVPALLKIYDDNRVETQERLAQAQKMEAIGRLAGGIAHDLNNILMPILNYTDFILEAVHSRSPVDPEWPAEMRICVKRAVQVVGQILVFSRHQNAECSAVPLGMIIKEVLRLMRSTLPASIEIETQISVEHDLVWGNATDLHLVLLNLCTNAFHAMKEHGGSLCVSLAKHEGPMLGWSATSRPFAGNLLRLSVSDSGTGILPEVVPKIFDPFFTTKKQGEGTGMGLSIVLGIVNRFSGNVSVETQAGAGSTFHVYLPLHMAAQGAAAAEPPEITDGKWELRKVRAMVVDDEYSITRMASRVLPKYGIEVETENDSRRAATILEERAGDFDVLITDQTMPSLTGIELARRARAIRPSLHVVLCSGYTDIEPEDVRRAGIRLFQTKPVNYRDLACLIQKWMDGANEESRDGIRTGQRRLLVLEDDPMVEQMCRRMLGMHFAEWEVVAFRNGAEAFEYLKDNAVDLMVLDLNVPGMDTGHLLVNLRDAYSREARSIPPCVFCSGVGSALKEIHRHCGHSRWVKLVKPYTADELVGGIRRLLGLSREGGGSPVGAANAPVSDEASLRTLENWRVLSSGATAERVQERIPGLIS